MNGSAAICRLNRMAELDAPGLPVLATVVPFGVDDAEQFQVVEEVAASPVADRVVPRRTADFLVSFVDLSGVNSPVIVPELVDRFQQKMMVLREVLQEYVPVQLNRILADSPRHVTGDCFISSVGSSRQPVDTELHVRGGCGDCADRLLFDGEVGQQSFHPSHEDVFRFLGSVGVELEISRVK